MEVNKVFEETVDRTQTYELTDSGVWRTNRYLEDSSPTRVNRGFKLRHVTSFQEKSMELHGKRLRESFINYVNSKNTQWEDPEQDVQFNNEKIEDWDDIEDVINQATS